MTEDQAGKLLKTARGTVTGYIRVVKAGNGRYGGTHAATETGQLACGTQPHKNASIAEVSRELKEATCRSCRSSNGVPIQEISDTSPQVTHVTETVYRHVIVSTQTADRQRWRGLARFAGDGAVTHGLRQSLRHYTRSPGHPHHPQSGRLLQYVAARGTDLGPVGADFAAACDQADRADAARTAKPPGRAASDAAKAPESSRPGYLPPRRRPNT